mgnify:CR=1 FL=1
MRINKYLSAQGVCSRREADRLLEAGRITVDGVTAMCGQQVDDNSVICIDGSRISDEKPQDVLMAFNKPRGIVCTTTDNQGKNNIVDYIGYDKRIYPVGRLDKDSDGLILLTNNGEITDKILRSVNGHEKEYVVKKGEVSLVIPVTMIRTKALQTEEKGIDMELLPNGHFTTYYDYGSSDSTSWVKTQRLKLILLFSEFMNEPPSQWNPYMFGEFSAKKFALICDEMDIPREEFNKKSEEAGYILSRMGYIGSYMKKYLADEKAAGRTVYEEDGITEMTMGPQAQ